MESRFEFKAQDMETMNREIGGTSKIRNIAKTPEGEILCLGQLKTLFGEPLYISEDLEDQYAYCIMAVDGDGKEIYLHAYSGPSGAAIGGGQDADSRAAADELAERITSAHPSDYDYEGYYMDGPCSVKMGVRNGEPYMEEESLSEEEMIKLCEEMGFDI